MATVILRAESLQDDTVFGGYWQLKQIERIPVTNVPDEQHAARLPSAWTRLHVKPTDSHAQALAHALGHHGLMPPGWYAEFNTGGRDVRLFAGEW